jgi:hypothetical protein
MSAVIQFKALASMTRLSHGQVDLVSGTVPPCTHRHSHMFTSALHLYITVHNIVPRLQSTVFEPITYQEVRQSEQEAFQAQMTCVDQLHAINLGAA